MDPFVEIEIESSEVAMQGQKITPLVRDPIREKFYDMRSLAPNNPNTWHDAKLFYRQGKFMEDFTDDYDQIAPLSMYASTYQRLGYEQLRTYFTWRTKMQDGEFRDVPVSYLFLHIYELLNNIGAHDPAHGLVKLVRLWDAYRGQSKNLDESIATWLKDYHVYHELPHSFLEFVTKHSLRDLYRKTFLFDFDPETTLENWAGIAEYDMSAFCTGEHRELMRTGFYHAAVAMQKHFESRSEGMVDFFYFESPKIWWPFDDAIFHPTLSQTNRVVSISASEVYRYENGRWHTRDLTPYGFTNNSMGYFIMVMETALRDLVGFKGKAIKGAARYKNAMSMFSKMTIVDELTHLFESVAKEVYRDATRIVVTVDTQNLSRIREEAEVTQEKLIVDENASQLCHSGLDPESSCNSLQTKLTTISINEACPTDFILKIAGQARNDGGGNDGGGSNDRDVGNDVQIAGNPWSTFKNSLTATELEALQISLSNPNDIKTFASTNNIMLEILADGINEKAMDTIGDNILELSDTMEIYEDYISEIKELANP